MEAINSCTRALRTTLARYDEAFHHRERRDEEPRDEELRGKEPRDEELRGKEHLAKEHCGKGKADQLERYFYALANVVQWCLVEYLAERICRQYQLGGASLTRGVSQALLSICHDDLFAIFRERLEQDPQLALVLARRISDVETATADLTARDRLYTRIFCRHLGYRHVTRLLAILAGDRQVRCLLVQALIDKRTPNAPETRACLKAILHDDAEGVAAGLMLPLLHQNHLEELLGDLRSPTWQLRKKAHEQAMRIFRGQA